ncbi:UNVERIFIED_CONTAM: ISLre2 family transposase [Streptococcus canis]|uniref:ISLre2 family transposase n=1 Tax=Streptococcus canis TaxID=1329 RepID=UPI000B8AA2B8|nr:ISLre2 family transposase [Streptococcus canis]GFG47272.1 hypothetical protein ScFU97_06110 [Streptococcus canis]
MTIIPEISEILKSSKHLSELEEAIISLMRDEISASLSASLESLDKELVQTHLSEGWEIDRLEERQLTFSFGMVSFKRRRIRKAGEKSFLPLDKALGLEQRQRFSPGIKEKISELAAGMPFRKASETLELLTDIAMNHQTVHKITQGVAEKVSDSRLADVQQLKKPKVLYIEADGVWIGSQEKQKQLEFKRGFIHEGVMKKGKRGSLNNPVYFGTFGSSHDLFQTLSDYLSEHYDLRETLIIANSDGGSGYESNRFEAILGRYRRYEYCLDSYHVMRQITGKLGFNKSLQAEVRQAVKAYDVERVSLLLDTEESHLEDEKQLERLMSLRAYLERHWEAIQPLSQRHLTVSSGVGVCESGHRYYTNRMKRQGRNWLKQGAENMTTLLTALRNKDFKERYRDSHPDMVFSPAIQVSLRKILKRSPSRIARASFCINKASRYDIHTYISI